MTMDQEDRRLLTETHAQSAVTASKVDDFIEWSKKAHEKRDEEISVLCAKIEDHSFYIRLLKWVITPLTPVGVLGAVVWVVQFVRGRVHGG